MASQSGPVVKRQRLAGPDRFSIPAPVRQFGILRRVGRCGGMFFLLTGRLQLWLFALAGAEYRVRADALRIAVARDRNLFAGLPGLVGAGPEWHLLAADRAVTVGRCILYLYAAPVLSGCSARVDGCGPTGWRVRVPDLVTDCAAAGAHGVGDRGPVRHCLHMERIFQPVDILASP